MPTENRIRRVETVLARRRPDLRVVLEEVRNTHNASAVIRTCDAVGVLDVDIIYAGNDEFPVNRAISTQAHKWLRFHRHSSAADCFADLRDKGFVIAATHLDEKAVPYTEIDFTRPIAVVFGNEAEGVSPAALEQADILLKIPMFGMAQSLNLSVSAGVILYEAVRQRGRTGVSSGARLSEEEFAELRTRWLS